VAIIIVIFEFHLHVQHIQKVSNSKFISIYEIYEAKLESIFLFMSTHGDISTSELQNSMTFREF